MTVPSGSLYHHQHDCRMPPDAIAILVRAVVQAACRMPKTNQVSGLCLMVRAEIIGGNLLGKDNGMQKS